MKKYVLYENILIITAMSGMLQNENSHRLVCISLINITFVWDYILSASNLHDYNIFQV